MKLIDLIHRPHPPVAWQEGDNIPWHEPGFSQRMLAEHLTQAHDRASRRSAIIDQHVAWIHDTLLQGKPTRILDLGCGPGLYTNRLAALGHRCIGVDYSPASIAYAQESANQKNRAATYIHADMRAANYGTDHGLIMLLFGELNVFSRQDATIILTKARDALQTGGVLLLEPHLYESLLPKPHATHTWFSSPGGLFSSLPHLVLTEEFWDQAASTMTRRYYVIDAATGEVMRYAQTLQAYTTTQYRDLLEEIGFTDVTLYPGLAHDRLAAATDFCVITATRTA